MIIKAYILAADAAWIEASVLSYYDLVDEIIVSYDLNGRGWTGSKIGLDDCLSRLRGLDQQGKMRYCPGHYARLEFRPMENETYQRQCALREAGEADWILQLDTDEVLPQPDRLLEVLRVAEERGIPAVEWPMRVLFRRLADGQFLEVCASDRADRFEYPGPIAVRPEAHLATARRTENSFLRPVICGDRRSMQICRPEESGEHRLECLQPDEAIVHNSWARTAGSIRQKIKSWGHNEGLKSWMFYWMRWHFAPCLWPHMRDFHPFARGLWPSLKVCESLPQHIDPRLYANIS